MHHIQTTMNTIHHTLYTTIHYTPLHYPWVLGTMVATELVLTLAHLPTLAQVWVCQIPILVGWRVCMSIEYEYEYEYDMSVSMCMGMSKNMSMSMSMSMGMSMSMSK